MTNNLILRTSNELGNQMFMYAAAYSMSKKLDRNLYIDDETAFLLRKNISTYGLNNFKISGSIAPDNLKFKNLKGYIKRKLLIKSDFLRFKKKFYIEKKDLNKITQFDDSFLNNNYDDNLFLEGHFESEKYFCDYKKEIINDFRFKNENELEKNIYLNDLCVNNSVSICLRQNRFSEGLGKQRNLNKEKSTNFTNEQINYINKSVELIKSKIEKPTFFLWSNDFSNIPIDKFNFEYKEIDLSKINNKSDKRILSLFLMTKCNHFIVTISSFNWWGAWLAKKNNKIIIRPSNTFFSTLKVNNRNFWPETWFDV